MSRRVIITGGGTGGHIFPAISIANALKVREPDMDILFVGADGGMEMTVVPQYGYPIKSVTISGIARSITARNIVKNLKFPFKLLRSLRQSRKIIKEFGPEVVVGVGGYASGPVGRVAAKRGIPLVICEQNAYPGITNKWLAKAASRILLGNDAAAKFFDKAKTKVTGNPVRDTLFTGTREKGLENYGFSADKPVLFLTGGSLGARKLNEAMEKGLDKLLKAGIQVIWQCGKRYHQDLSAQIPQQPGLHLLAFVEDMANTFAAADLVISRAGASTIQELILLEKPSILVPSPNVSEDHQTKNALSLVEHDAAMMVKDVEVQEKLISSAIAILTSKKRLEALRKGIAKLEKHDAAKEIADEIFALMKRAAKR